MKIKINIITQYPTHLSITNILYIFCRRSYVAGLRPALPRSPASGVFIKCLEYHHFQHILYIFNGCLTWRGFAPPFQDVFIRYFIDNIQ